MEKELLIGICTAVELVCLGVIIYYWRKIKMQREFFEDMQKLAEIHAARMSKRTVKFLTLYKGIDQKLLNEQVEKLQRDGYAYKSNMSSPVLLVFEKLEKTSDDERATVTKL